MTRDKLINLITNVPQEHGKDSIAELLTTNEIEYIADTILQELDPESTGSSQEEEESEDEILVRCQVSDVTMSKSKWDALESKYVVMEVELFDPEFTLPDGTECDENGDPL